ncbi:helix-hairpin-helix domain-containing protein, partial [Candidatus Cyanaurora vandensis]|uniref:ComEA family DNA-binding protein n=1 Tax=Candidatus Cyanaurora vandensis TaxID=2714958 RepID=UPI00257BB113
QHKKHVTIHHKHRRPALGDAPTVRSAPLKPDAPKTVKSSTVVVDLNRATATELQQVKGIGKATADKIMAGRPYTAPTELVTKKVMSQKQFDKYKAQFTVTQ